MSTPAQPSPPSAPAPASATLVPKRPVQEALKDLARLLARQAVAEHYSE